MNKKELRKEVIKFLEEWEQTTPPNVCIDDDMETFEGSAYSLLKSCLQYLK